MPVLSPLQDYKGEIWKDNNKKFQLWYKRFLNFISQPFPYESSQLNPPNQKDVVGERNGFDVVS
jgi:hypothetical protein